MKTLTAEEIKQVTKGKVISEGNVEINSVVIDSRKAKEKSLFVAIKGEREDGSDYINSAFSRGAVAALTEKKVSPVEGKLIIQVDDVKKSLMDLARYYRRKMSIPIIALTGSSGKTTTKDIISSILSVKYKVHKTQGNQNNDLGVPLTLFGIEQNTELAVVEMGMNHLGEIRELVNIALPDIAVITNIGVTHLEHLGTQENIFKAKCEILETLNDKQLALLNGDDSYLKTVKSEKYIVKNFGIENEKSSIRAENIISSKNGIDFDIIYEGDKAHFSFSLPGRHNVYNCLIGIYLGRYFNLSFEEIQIGLDNFTPSSNRMDIKNIKGYKVINDCYNANPDAMKAALDVLVDLKTKEGRAIAVIGDMLEIGEDSPKFHKEIGSYIVEKGSISHLIAVGRDAKYYVDGAKEMGMDQTYYFEENNSAIDFLKQILLDGDVVLIKGSRSMSMEEIVEALERS